jgi:hypothetical protein
MNSTQKFDADIRKILKQRESALSRVVEAFCGNFSHIQNLARGIGDYWLKKYIEPSASPNEEPTREHIDWLLDAFSFLSGDEDDFTAITLDDWKEIRDIISCEADGIPLKTLTQLMSCVVDKGALR